MFNDQSQKDLRKKLRNEMSPVEVLLWARLKGSQLEGYKFRRQYGVGSYVVDFYCPKKRLVVEVDGEEHFLSEGEEEHDKRRDEFLGSCGMKVLHVTGKEVNENMEGVIERILEVLSDTIPQSQSPLYDSQKTHHS